MANLKDTTVKFVNKDFEGFKRDLMRYAQAHFSGSYQDFNEASPGMMVLELQAYVADVLAYYMDQQFLEIKAETARQVENIEAFAKMRGYRPKGVRAARVQEKWVVAVPASSSAGKPVPDLNYAPIIRAGSQAIGPNSVTFELIEDLDMTQVTASNGNTLEWQVSQVDANGHPTQFALRQQGEMVAARTVTERIAVGDFESFLRVPLGNTSVIEVIDVFDDQGFQWYEVDFLAQNTVFDQIVNTGSDQQVVPYVLRYRAAPRRFVVDQSLANNTVYLQFGNGEGTKNDDDLIPNIANLALPLPGRQTFTTFAIDPQNFLQTKGLGLSPHNTTLTVRYRVGGGSNTNVDANTINKPGNVSMYINSGSLTPSLVDTVVGSVECINLVPSEGGGPAETVSDIKANADSYFATQMRAVTREDFLAHVLTMPARFGRPVKAYIKNTEFNRYAVDLHVLSEDVNGNLSAPTDILKQNIKTYLGKLRMMTEGINILSADIINIGVRFGVVVSSKFNRSEVVSRCLLAIKDYLNTDSAQIGQPLVLSDMKSVVQNVDGVISVYRFDVTNLVGNTGGLQYSNTSFDVEANTANGIVYCPANAIFEVKFPDTDIAAEAK